MAADGESRPLNLVYGRDVRDWWYDPAKVDAETTDRAKVVWTGLNPVAHEFRFFVIRARGFLCTE